MPPASSRSTPGHSPQNHLSPLAPGSSSRVSPLASPHHSFSYRRFSATNSRVSDERGAGADDPPEEAIEDELEEDPEDKVSEPERGTANGRVGRPAEKPDQPRDRSISSNRDEKPERTGPLGVFSGRWGGNYAGRWRVGFGPSNERGVEEDAESVASARSVPSRVNSPAPTPKLEEDVKADKNDPTPPPSARKRKRELAVTGQS